MSARPNYDVNTIRQQDLQHHFHPLTDFSTFKDTGSMIFTGAEGAYVYDIEGKRYLDGIGGLWCVNMGYGREEISRPWSIRRAGWSISAPSSTPPPCRRPSWRQSSPTLAPGAEPCLLHLRRLDGQRHRRAADPISTSEPARQARPRRHVIARLSGYHGSTFLTGSISGKPADRSPHLEFIDRLDPSRLRAQCLSPAEGHDRERNSATTWSRSWSQDPGARRRQRRLLLRRAGDGRGWRDRAARGLSPPHGRGLPPPYDVIYISDEVVTGFGRLGHMFASKDVFGIEPDMIVCAKGLTSGYQPLGRLHLFR